MAPSFSIEDVLQKASISEKVSLLSGGAFWATQGLPQYNIPSIRLSDGPNGVRGNKFFNGVPAACIPCGTGLAATWDRALLEQAGSLIGRECIAKGAHCWLGPTTNIQRSPIGGRGFESFSEDPYLSGKLAASIMTGVHGTGILTCMKHYAANDQEQDRRAVNCIITERALREIYLLPFQIALGETRPAAIMTAYNKVNGIHASESSHLIQDILRGEWDQDLLVMSDWFGTYSVVESLEAGLDLEMPGPPRWRTMLAELSVSSSKLLAKTVDERVSSLLKFVLKAERTEVADEQGARNTEEDRLLNRKLAADSIVLLKNTEAVLPLGLSARSETKRKPTIALLGPSMKEAYFSGGGSASLEPYYAVSPYEGITQSLPRDVNVQYEVGCYAHAFLPTLKRHITRSPDNQPGCWIRFFNQPADIADRVPVDEVAATDSFYQLMDYRHPQLDRLFWATLEADFTSPSTGTLEFGLTVSGTAKLFVDDKLVIDNTHDQREGTSFLGNGSAEERGELEAVQGRVYKLRLEFASSPTSTIKKPGVVAFPGGGARVGCALKIDEDLAIQSAAKLARECDVAVLCVGLSGDWESEGFDRPDMDLPGRTDQLVTAVLRANPRTVVVTQSGTPIDMTRWSDLCTTHCHMWYGGCEGGNGLADVLLGVVNPSGRLPLTFPRHLKDNPAFLNMRPEAGRILYAEDIYVGYRYYEKVEREVLYPFGFGLSYTQFSWHDAVVEPASDGQSAVVKVTVQNSGSRTGAEVVQVYVAPPRVPERSHEGFKVPSQPVKELRGFAKIQVDPGATATAVVELDKLAGAFWDERDGCWRVPAGEHRVLVGRSSKEIVLERSWYMDESRAWNGV